MTKWLSAQFRLFNLPATTKRRRYNPRFGVDATDAAKSAVGSGTMVGTIKQDADGMAKTIGVIMKNLFESKNAFDGIDAKNIVGNWRVNIPYSAYTAQNE